jgi:hypothetical protein
MAAFILWVPHRVQKLDLGACTNLMNLPNSICQLQNLEYLSFKGSKFVKYLKNVEDINKHSMLAIASTKLRIYNFFRCIITPISTNLSDFNDGCCSMAFQKL